MTNRTFPRRHGDESLCDGCTACCRWPGDVFFPPDALSAVADCLEMDERDCADMFFVLSKDRKRLQTKPTIDGRCIFVGEHGCRVYPHRPKQCRTFPYTWQRPEKEFMDECPLYQHLLARDAPPSRTDDMHVAPAENGKGESSFAPADT